MENIGLIHAKQQAYRDCYIPPKLRELINIDWKNLTIWKNINSKEKPSQNGKKK